MNQMPHSKLDLKKALDLLKELMVHDGPEHEPKFNSYYYFNWDNHASLPEANTKYGPGIYSMLQYKDSNRADRLISMNTPGLFPKQIHEDMDEYVKVLKGSVTEVSTNTFLTEGQEIKIPAGVEHSFIWDENDVILNLTYIKK